MSDIILLKKKKMEIIKKINENSFCVKFKKKTLFLHTFSSFNELNKYLSVYKEFKTIGVSVPKILYVDKKTFSFASEYIDGPKVIELISKEELPDRIYEQIFLQAWYAKSDKLCLNFTPDKFRYFNSKLYYLSPDFESYDEKNAFQIKWIRYWIYSKELIDLLKEKGYPIDTSRLKDEYLTNKEIVLKTVKFYR